MARGEFLNLRGGLKPFDAPDDREKRYCGYACGKEGIVRMCNLPSPQMTGEDLMVEKKIPALWPRPAPVGKSGWGKAGKAAALRRKSAAAFFQEVLPLSAGSWIGFPGKHACYPQGRASGIRRTSSAVGRVLRMVPSLSERICPPAVPVRRTSMLSSKGGACQK